MFTVPYWSLSANIHRLPLVTSHSLFSIFKVAKLSTKLNSWHLRYFLLIALCPSSSQLCERALQCGLWVTIYMHSHARTHVHTHIRCRLGYIVTYSVRDRYVTQTVYLQQKDQCAASIEPSPIYVCKGKEETSPVAAHREISLQLPFLSTTGVQLVWLA